MPPMSIPKYIILVWLMRHLGVLINRFQEAHAVYARDLAWYGLALENATWRGWRRVPPHKEVKNRYNKDNLCEGLLPSGKNPGNTLQRGIKNMPDKFLLWTSCLRS